MGGSVLDVRLRRWSSLCRVATAGVVLTLVLAPPSNAQPTSGVEANQTFCGGDAGGCLLPFPSSDYLQADPTSATGVRVVIPPGAIPSQLTDQLGAGGTFKDAFDGADGFSPLAPIVFQVPGDIDPASVPADGGDLIGVWNSQTGQRAEIRAELSPFSNNPDGSRNIILVWPRTAFEFGGHYFAAIRPGLKTRSGETVVGNARRSALGLGGPSRTSRVEALGAGGLAGRALELRLLRLSFALEPEGPVSQYVTATSFVVRTEENAVGQTLQLAQAVRAADHPVRGLQVLPSFIPGATTVTGQLLTTDFRDSRGAIPRDVALQGKPKWVDFLLTVPERSAGAAGAPVVIYGHGITINKETQLLLAGQNARRGLATVSIDIPNHGSRAYEDGFVLDHANPAGLGRLASMVVQGPLDNLSLLLALKTHLATVDLLPSNPFTPGVGDGVADLDTTHVFYQGTSMGGVLGLTFLAIAPEVDGGFLQVGGAGILDIIFHSALWDLSFKNVVPYPATYAEASVLTSGAQTLLDRGDAALLLPRLRASGTPVYLVYALDDGIVGNASSERMIQMLGLPLAGQELRPLSRGVSSSRIPVAPNTGWGAEQIPTGSLSGNWLAPLLTHTSFVDPVPSASVERWLDDFVVPTASGQLRR